MQFSVVTGRKTSSGILYEFPVIFFHDKIYFSTNQLKELQYIYDEILKFVRTGLLEIMRSFRLVY